jgi:hypothetical protein
VGEHSVDCAAVDWGVDPGPPDESACTCTPMTPTDPTPDIEPPMVRMSVEMLRALLRPYGGSVTHGPVDRDGNVTSVHVHTPPPERKVLLAARPAR